MNNYALIGSGIAYALSPMLHRRIFCQFGLSSYRYDLLDVPPDRFSLFWEEMRGKYIGFNVTIPYKQKIMGCLTECHDAGAGSINTVLRTDRGWKGYNTDVPGFQQDIVSKIQLERKLVCVLGSGGAARAVLCALHKQGARMQLRSRNQTEGDRLKLQYGLTERDAPPQIVINCTGAHLLNTGLFDTLPVGSVESVYDLSYCFPDLAEAFRLKGIQYYAGTGMLIRQAILSAKILYGLHLTAEETEALYLDLEAHLEEKKG